METIDEALAKRFGRSLVHLMKLIDPERRYSIDEHLGKAWDALSLTDQRRLYLYLLYRKWRGLDIYGEPYFVIKNCHPVPFNWNGQSGIDELIKSNRVVIARYKGAYGTYTYDEARLYEMTDIQPLTK